jgi:acyl-coenzyme A synthetase/AMP-(fatty) acid ligase
MLSREPDFQATQPIDFLLARIDKDPDGLLFDDGVNAVSNKAALHFAQQLARYFKELGVNRGDIVGLNMPPALYIYFMLATWHQNAIATNYTIQVARGNTWKPEWIFSTVEYEATFGKSVILITQEILDYVKTLEPLTDAKSYGSNNDPIALVFSSGTTGAPKAFPLALANLESRMPVYFDTSLGFSGSLVMLDIGTAAGIGAFYGELRTYGCYLIPGDAQANIKHVKKHQTRSILGSPNQITEFLQATQNSPSSDVQIEKILVTGAMLSRETAKELKNYFNCEIINSYGSSEAGLVSSRSDESVNPFDLGDVIDGIQVEIVDDEDKTVAEGVTGRIRTKSQSVVSGYFRDQANTHSFFTDGWFYSGDLGHFEKGNRLFLDGRNSELINAGGVKINPAKIDEFIVGKFGIKDAGTFGYVDSTGAEKIGIAVVLASDFVEQALVAGIHEFYGTSFPIDIYKVDQVIRNDRGKVARLEIAEKYLQSIGEKN